MIKINIVVSFALLVLATADLQDNTIISMQSEVYCENGSIPDEYLHVPLYACADAKVLSTKIEFSLEDIITPVNRMSMPLDSSSPNGCFTYTPRHKEFKMCFKASTTNIKFYPNDKQQIFISRAIYFGEIGHQYEDDQVWPIINPVYGYYQCNVRFTPTYSALKDDKIKITYVIDEQTNYIVKLTVEEENPSSNIQVKKWKQNDNKYLLNTELRLSRRGESVEFIAKKDINFRVYFYTFTRNRIQMPVKLDIMAKIMYGNPARGDSQFKTIY